MGDVRNRTAATLEPGSRVVWAPIKPGTVYVLDLDDDHGAAPGVLVEVPKEAPDDR